MDSNSFAGKSEIVYNLLIQETCNTQTYSTLDDNYANFQRGLIINSDPLARWNKCVSPSESLALRLPPLRTSSCTTLTIPERAAMCSGLGDT